MINIDNLINDIEQYKAVVITSDPILVDFFSKSAEEIAEDYTKKKWKPVAQLLGVKLSGKELEVVKRMIKAYNDLF